MVVVENLDLEGSRNVPLRIGRMHCTMMDVTADGLTGVGRGHVIGRCSPTFGSGEPAIKLGAGNGPGPAGRRAQGPSFLWCQRRLLDDAATAPQFWLRRNAVNDNTAAPSVERHTSPKCAPLP